MSCAVILRATLADGRVLEGPVRGNGGMLGSGSLATCGYEAAGMGALRVLAIAERMAAAGRAIAVYEPWTGHVALFPRYSAQGDGPGIQVPLAGTTWEVVPEGWRAPAPALLVGSSPMLRGGS